MTRDRPIELKKSLSSRLRTARYYWRHAKRLIRPIEVEATYVVLGMHRSGTSIAAGLLQQLGVHMGRWQLGPNPANPKGHFENILIYWLNKDILRASGGSWFDPPSEEAIQAVAWRYRPRIAATLRMERVRVWGWKDPRSVLTLPLFMPHLEHVRVVDCRRDPEAIARSIARREGVSESFGVDLAGLYNDRLDRLIDGIDAPALRLEFDDWFSGDSNLDRLAEFAGQPLDEPRRQALREFIIDRGTGAKPAG